MYFVKFFYGITFHIIVILILGNIFLGIIVDAFAVLRDKGNIVENDKKRLCFVCSISNAECLSNGVEFVRHKDEEHYRYDYIYFICYLLNKSPVELNEYESYAIKSIIKGKSQWMPAPEK